ACSRMQFSTSLTKQPTELGSVLTILFFAADYEQSPQAINAMLHEFCIQEPIDREIKEGPYADSMRTMLGQWVERHDMRTNVEKPIDIILRYDLPAGLVRARAM